MPTSLNRRLNNFIDSIGFWFRFIRGTDYQTLSHYILRINQHKETRAILQELSKCLKDILDYELFGFALKNGDTTDIWIDPQTCSAQFSEYIAKDCKCQKNDFTVNHFADQDIKKSRNFDTLDINNLISYHVIDSNFIARLYILPKKRMLRYYDSIISTIIRSVTIALEKNLNIRDLENAAAVDPLTNCYNRRALHDFLKRDIAGAKRHANDLSVIMFDLDNFKEINDLHGHLAGDAVLRDLSTLITSLVRKSDYLARYGGEEFVLVLPETTLYSAIQLAEKLRKWVEGYEVMFGTKRITVTASFGVAGLENKKTSESLLHEADMRLYKAKAQGKNIVVPSLLPGFADKRFAPKKPVRKYAGVAHAR